MNRHTKVIFSLLALCSTIVAAHGCANGSVSVVADVDLSGWNPDTAYSVAYRNSDTASLRKLSVFVLNERSIAVLPDSIPLTITTITPDSLIFSEAWTLFPDRAAEAESAVFSETMRSYRSRVRLDHEGDYKFIFSHRCPISVKGIRGIGMEIVMDN